MRRAAAALAAAGVIAGCGGDGGGVPRGDPAVRHGERAGRDFLAIEEVRAPLAAASDAYYAGGGPGTARSLLRLARTRYGRLARRVRARDRELDREIGVAFRRADRSLARAARPDAVRDTIAPLVDQLMDGALQTLVPRRARLDPGLQADVMARLLERIAVLRGGPLPRVYAGGWGYLRRAQALHVALAEDLGPQKGTITAAFERLRRESFPTGALAPPGPEPEPPTRAVDRIRAALEERFALVHL